MTPNPLPDLLAPIAQRPRRKSGTPSADTSNRVFAALKPEAFPDVFTITSASFPLENRATGTYDFQSDSPLTGGQMDNLGLERTSGGGVIAGTDNVRETFDYHAWPWTV